MLWFGYKKMYLWYSEQQCWNTTQVRWSCDLVTKKCIFDILNNQPAWINYMTAVVIWLQKNVSLIFWTTESRKDASKAQLWFGYKKMYLWYSEQQENPFYCVIVCCDLVTKKCIFDILNNGGSFVIKLPIVVIWLQKNVSLIFWTTDGEITPDEWSCDLVTKKCIFDILNNISWFAVLQGVVVIWLQKNVSLIFWTTWDAYKAFKEQLWFGYKKMYLWYSEQLIERLEMEQVVVIWLQKNVSLIFWTTPYPCKSYLS